MSIKKIWLGAVVTVLICGFVLMGCDLNGGNDDENTLPESKGVNALSGKTYFEYSSKIAFSVTGEDSSSGTYSVFNAIWAEGGGYELENGKYTYIETETGGYSWDDDAKTVTRTPEKIAESDRNVYGPLQTKSEYRASAQASLDQYRQEIGEEAFNQELAGWGFSSAAAYLNYWVNEVFANKTGGYSFSADSRALFLEEALPANKGANELSGQTFNGMRWDSGQDKNVKDTNLVYTFYADGSYTFTDNATTGYQYPAENGKYMVDSSQSRKWVYLRPADIGGKTRDEYYAAQTIYGDHPFINDDDYRAAQTNNAFRVYRQPYNNTNKTTGWED
jgi:hypothetical protein